MAEIVLTNGMVALVDDADLPLLAGYAWRAMRASTAEEKWYAVRSVGSSAIYMHREIMVATDKVDVDHRDRNGLHNQRANLRLATRAQNIRAKVCKPGVSGFRGVTRNRAGRRKPWCAVLRLTIGPNGERPALYLGAFADPIEAARAWDAAALDHFGEFAMLNFPEQL